MVSSQITLPFIYEENDLKDLFSGKLSFLLHSPMVLLLEGEMGAGKTTFVHEFACALGIEEPITSPTYAYVNCYKTKDEKKLAHFDLYRLTSEKDFYSLGFEDFFNGSYDFCIVEWPDRAQGFFKMIPHTKIMLEHNDILTRKLTIAN